MVTVSSPIPVRHPFCEYHNWDNHSAIVSLQMSYGQHPCCIVCYYDLVSMDQSWVVYGHWNSEVGVSGKIVVYGEHWNVEVSVLQDWKLLCGKSNDNSHGSCSRVIEISHRLLTLGHINWLKIDGFGDHGWQNERSKKWSEDARS